MKRPAVSDRTDVYKRQIQKKVKKGKSVVEIAEELEEAIDMVELIYDMVTAYPEGTKEAVYQRMNNCLLYTSRCV